jgi:hypothetical protein
MKARVADSIDVDAKIIALAAEWWRHDATLGRENVSERDATAAGDRMDAIEERLASLAATTLAGAAAKARIARKLVADFEFDGAIYELGLSSR